MKFRLARAIDDLVERYFHLPRRRRMIVGWSVLLTALVLIGGAIFGTCKGVAVLYRGIVASFDSEEVVADKYETLSPKREYRVERLNKKKFYYARDFSEKNDVHLAAARRIGITPLSNREEAETQKKKLVLIEDCNYYKVDRLTHSIPYLVPEASDFLLELGKIFQEYSATESRFIITSVLRTQRDVKRLRRSGNVNASPNSAHFYGTTIDITYNRFDRRGRTTDGRLKEALARALYDMQQAGYCYVKYEYKQACFHITVRK